MRKTVTKRMILTLIMVFSMYCLVACGGETQNEVISGNNNGLAINNETDKPEATAEPTEEPSSEVAQATAEPTEEPVLYPGIDMESDMYGEDWIETFVGIIDQPKVVVYSDETGRKEIVEEEAVVEINPEEDIIAVYLPDGYKYANRTMGINEKEAAIKEHSRIFFLDVEVTREKKVQMAAIYVECDGEEIALNFTLVPVE